MATLFCSIAHGQMADSEAARDALDECVATAARLMGASDRCRRHIGVRFSGLKTWNAE